MDVFDFLANHYNAMTGFPGRIGTLADAMRPWVEEYRVKTALDAGCGGGALLFALRKLGVEAVGLDLSEPMLRLALDNARQMGEKFEFCGAPYRSAGAIYPSRFDAVFALGNALISHETDADMDESLRSLCASLRPGGLFLAQLLNLAPFHLGLKTVISKRRVADTLYLRYAVPVDGCLHFTALALGPSDSVDLHSSRWSNWNRDRLLAAMERSGFTDVAAFGSFGRDPYEPRRSVDLVVIGRRPLETP